MATASVSAPIAAPAAVPVTASPAATPAGAGTAGVSVLATNLGFPRIGVARELKKALEAYWAGAITKLQLLAVAKALRATHWQLQSAAGIADGHIPSNDFALYDHILATAVLVGAVPSRYGWDASGKGSGTGSGTGSGSGAAAAEVPVDMYFAMARGDAKSAALEMTKWFDTNYHYLVPEFAVDQHFQLTRCDAADTPAAYFAEALALGIRTRPVLIGPVSFLLLGKMKATTAVGAGAAAAAGTADAAAAGGVPTNALVLLDRLLPVYEQVLQELAAAGAEWVQFDEPCFAVDRDNAARDALKKAYARLSAAAAAAPKSRLKLLVATYFDETGDNTQALCALPVHALHIDVHRAPQQLEPILKALSGAAQQQKVLSVGVVDGRNVWRNDLSASVAVVARAVKALGPARVLVAPSCSLLHTPVDLDSEKKSLDAEVKRWLAFSKQKLAEVNAIAQAASAAANGQPLSAAVKEALAVSDAVAAERKVSKRIHNTAVKERAAAVTADMLTRKSPFSKRIAVQRAALGLPLFPTTNIGSFPQTPDIRERRAEFKAGKLSATQYDAFLRTEIARVVKAQEELGLDVLVHGEPERNDMVEYFGEQLSGYVFSAMGWVQSYGSRYVKPPIIYGDVSRPKPMTVEWSKYAQSCTTRPMKGMLTGPITMLQWSFVRDDQPRALTAKQIALALRDEVVELESAGIRVIQIDEPALREGLPLRRANWPHYLQWAVDAFRLCAGGVGDVTQIHTHMCYAEFNDIIRAVAALDADVISIETSRSHMELLDAFGGNATGENKDFKYPNEIGPGVYDIHSPRIVSQADMELLLHKAVKVLKAEQLWVNPDCGLKTRKWEETKICLRNMVAAAKAMRAHALTAYTGVDAKSAGN